MTRPTARLVERWLRAVVGASAIGAGAGLAVAAHLGAMPWDVLHVGLARLLGVSVGTAITLVSAVVAAIAWGPLRVPPGPASMVGLVAPGAAADAVLAAIRPGAGLAHPVLLVAVSAISVAGGSVLMWSSGLGTGVRDALMVGLAARGWDVSMARSGIEVGALLVGWLLLTVTGGTAGGVLGWATVALAVVLGPLVGALRRVARADEDEFETWQPVRRAVTARSDGDGAGGARDRVGGAPARRAVVGVRVAFRPWPRQRAAAGPGVS